MKPILEALSTEFEEHLTLIKIDADVAENEELLRKYDVMSIPTLVLLDSDGKELGKQVGAQSLIVLREWIGNELGEVWDTESSYLGR